MKKKALLLTTILSAGVLFCSPVIARAADSIVTSTAKTGTLPVSKEALADPQVAAGNFVEHVNNARVAIAMKDVKVARQHIAQARSMLMILKGGDSERRRLSNVQAGRVVYEYDADYKYHYFPIQTNAIQVKHLSDGPMWAKNSLAVSDADVVYLTLDLSGDAAAMYLDKADTALNSNALKDASNQLAHLTESVVTVDSRASMPGDKARDNIALVRSFVRAKNYDGARYALKHADEALDEMQRSDVYKTYHQDIALMRKDVAALQMVITKKDPTMLQEADTKLTKWWTELKAWTKSDKE